MTSDAKIGLLLGLVFIFIIAFVINGLPRFQNAMADNEQAPEQTFVRGTDPIGLAERNTLGVDEIFQEEIIDPVPNEDDGPEFVNNNPWATNHARAEDNNTGAYYTQIYREPEPEPTTIIPEEIVSYVNENENTSSDVVINSDENERLRIELPTPVAAETRVPLEGSNNRAGSNNGGRPSGPFGAGGGFQMNGNNGIRPGGRANWNQPGGQQPGGQQPGGQQPSGQQPNRMGGFPQPNNNRQEANPTRDNAVTRQNTATGSVVPNTVNPTNPQERITNGSRQNPGMQGNPQRSTFKETTYVIKEGDNNLAKIAKKFYGEEEGNRLVNINKIFEANKKIMKSPDKIFVGQEIKIPQPATPLQTQPSDVLQGSMFQNVPSVGGGLANRTNNQRVVTGNVYVVKEDDSLWKIAANELGNGTRYEEISKLNKDILTNDNKLKPGMKLRMPAK